MNLAMTSAEFYKPGSITTDGASDTAYFIAFIAEQVQKGRSHLQSSHSLGLGAKSVLEDLIKVAEECRSANWDGYGAAPITNETFWQAYHFLSALPFGFPTPSVGAEPDGHLTFEWHRSSRRTLSISVSPEGELHYAALLGSSKAYGTEPFSGMVPKLILDLIHRVCFI
jgi:hypothetical protein